MTEQEKTIFFALIRSAIWQTPIDLSLFEKPNWTWKNVLRNLHHQQLIGVVSSVLLDLPGSYLPDNASILYIKSVLASQTKKHYAVNKAIPEIFDLLEDAGCRPVLLKGQGLASLYPNSNLRPCGDIDIYVGEEDYIKACHLIDQYCGLPFQSVQKSKENHYEARYKGDAIIEIHRTSGEPVLSEYQKDYLQWEKESLQPVSCSHIVLTGKIVSVPSLSFNSVYLLNHYLSHQREFGIGLRQLVDYAMVLQALDQKEIPQIKTFGFLRPYQIIAGILHFQLGLSPEHIPYFDPKIAIQSQGRVLSTLLENGNFGRSNKLHHEQYSYGFKRWYYIIRNRFHQLRSIYVLLPQLAIREAIHLFPNALCRFALHYYKRVATFACHK